MFRLETLAMEINILLLTIAKFYSRIILKKLKSKELKFFREVEKLLRRNIKINLFNNFTFIQLFFQVGLGLS